MRVALLSLLILPIAESLADPVWSRGEVVADLSVYPDHQDAALYYYEPAPYKLSEADGEPQLYFRLFRYLGTTETRDSNVFEVAAILTVDVEQDTVADRYPDALAMLRRRNSSASLRPLPIDGFGAELIYAAIDAAGQQQSGSVDAQASGNVEETAEEGPVQFWSQRRFTLALDTLTAQLFWDNFSNDRLQLSLDYRIETEGMKVNAEGAWEADARTFGGAVPLRVSMQEYADHFSRMESWQLANRRRTDVIVMCYDFFEEGAEDLYRVSIDVRFKTLRDQDYVESVRFESGAVETEKTVSFRLARNMDEPYYYRVTRIFKSGPVRESGWIEHQGLLLDVTSYAM